MGRFGTLAAMKDGNEMGAKAVADLRQDRKARCTRPKARTAPITFMPVWQPTAAGKGKAFVDVQSDVTVKDIKTAHQEGYVSVEHLKRYTTLGMGTDQGKTSNINAIAIMAGLRDMPIMPGRNHNLPPALYGPCRRRHCGPHHRPSLQALPPVAAA